MAGTPKRKISIRINGNPKKVKTNVQHNNALKEAIPSQTERELARYKAQLEALKKDHSYNNFEEKRTEIKNYYLFKIGELEAIINKQTSREKKALKNIEFKGRVVKPNQSG